MRIAEQELNQTFAKYQQRFGGRKQDYFALLYLSKEFEKPVEEIYPQVAFGGNDYGLDAFHIDKARKNLYLYQFKWSRDHSLFKESFDRLISKGMERIFGNPLQDQNQNEVLIQLKSALTENQAVIDRVLIHFVFNGDPDAADRSATLDSLREDLESKKFLIDQFFSRAVDLICEYRSNETRRLATATHVRKTYEYALDFQGSIPFETPNGDRLYVGFMRLMDLYSMYGEMGRRFFERNIRAGLSPDKPPNRAIRQALTRIVLQGTDSPQVFTFNHNGVTLAAENIELMEGKMRIVEPRLLNGAQTLTSLDKFVVDNEHNAGLRKNQERLRSILVLAKVVHSPQREFITGVTISNNKQNPVEPWNLRANDQIQSDFEDKFRDDLGIYYERQENMFESLTDEDLEERGIEQHKAIQLRPLAQTFLAVQGEVDRMSRLREVFESEQTYKSTFRESYLHSDSRKILLAYKIQFRLRSVTDSIVEKGPSKYAFVARARNLLWTLLIQGLLNDNDLASLSEEYGEDLVAQVGFTDYLRGLASRKIRFVLASAVAEPHYQAMIDNEKYSFLRTKAIYQSCMDKASRRYRWRKKSF